MITTKHGFYILALCGLLSACGAIPVSVQSTKQTSRQSSTQEVAQEAAQDVANDLNSKASQGTSSMPVIIICNTNNSPSAQCAGLPKDGPMVRDIQKRYKEGGQ